MALLEGLPVALIHQRDWIVTARAEVIRAECLARASKRRVRTMSDGVVPKSLRRDAWLFGQVLIRRCDLIVDSIEQHRDLSAKMRGNILMVGYRCGICRMIMCSTTSVSSSVVPTDPARLKSLSNAEHRPLTTGWKHEAEPDTVLIMAGGASVNFGVFVIEDRGAKVLKASNSRSNFTG
jgi:hypothetical protein